MYTVISLPQFTDWLNSLKDMTVQAAVLARITRLEQGLRGDFKSVGDGVFELRIHIGAGWRMYCTERGSQIILLLTGGSKRSQQKDIKLAKTIAASID